MCNNTAVQELIDRFFPAEGGGTIRNIKICSGHRREVSAEQIAQQILHAEEQIRTGKARRVYDVDGDLTTQ